MKNFLCKVLASLFIIFLATSPTFAAKKERFKLVLFYADWNVYSQKAISTLEEVANASDKITFEKINVDDKKAFLRMKQLKVAPTNAIPYYFLIDKNKDILFETTYKNESAIYVLNSLNSKIQD